MMYRLMVNLAFAILWGMLCVAHVKAFLLEPRPQYVLIVLLESVFVILFLVRRPARTQSRRLGEWIIAIAGTAAPLFMRPAPVEPWNPLIDVFQAAGMALALAAALALRRSFGVVPANRGVQVRGAYRLVRHPIYAGYLVSFCAYVAGNPSLWNIAVLIAALSLCLARIRREERHLSADAAYQAYCAATRWKLLPFMF